VSIINDSGHTFNVDPDMAQAHMAALRIVRPFISVNYVGSDAKIGRFVTKPEDYAAAVALGRDTFFNPGAVSPRYEGSTPPHLGDITDDCRVAWGEYDGTPDTAHLPESSIIVQSSSKNKQHLYWCIQDVLTADQLEMVNLAIIRGSNADPQTWNRNRLLRLAGSYRPSKGVTVQLIKADGPRYGSAELMALVSDEDRARQATVVASRQNAATGGAFDWTIAKGHAVNFINEWPDNMPGLALAIVTNQQPLHQFNDEMAECWGKTYRNWQGVMCGLASSLKCAGWDDAAIAGLLLVWRKQPLVCQGGNRSNDDRQIARGIEYAIAHAYGNDDAAPEPIYVGSAS
jgi:hypothetical protein